MAAPYIWTFTTAAPPPAPAVTSTTPANNATGAARATAPTATFNQAVTASSVTFTLKDAAGTTIPGTSSYTAATNTSTFTPTAAPGLQHHLHGHRHRGHQHHRPNHGRTLHLDLHHHSGTTAANSHLKHAGEQRNRKHHCNGTISNL